MAQFLDLAGLTRFKELLLSKIDTLLALKADASTVVRTDQANILTSSNTDFVSRTDTDSGLTLRAAPSGKGACLDLCGNDVTGYYSGVWQLSACNSGATYNLRGGKDGTLTFRGNHLVRSVNGTTADSDGNVTISIPAKTSDLVNDSGFLTAHQSLTDYAKKSEIPTKVSQLANDSGFLTTHQSLEAYATRASLSAVATSGSYNDLSDKPTALTFDDFYPVGSVYLTKDSAFDPSVKFGGTWVNESGGGDAVIVWHRTA